MKLYGSNELTYNGSVIFNQDNLTKLSQLENDIEVEGLDGPSKLQNAIDLYNSKIKELDIAIAKANELTLLLENRLSILEDIEKNRVIFV